MPRTMYAVVVQPGPDGTRLMLLENLIEVYTCPFGQVPADVADKIYVDRLLRRFLPNTKFINPKFFDYISWEITKEDAPHVAMIVDTKTQVGVESDTHHIWTSRPEELPITPPTRQIVDELRRIDWL